MFALIAGFAREGARGWKTEGGKGRVRSQTRVAWAQWKKEWQQLETNLRQGGELVWPSGLNNDCYPPLHTHTHAKCTKHLVTAKFTGVTSTVSHTSNSRVHSGYSCYTHLITVLPSFSASGFASLGLVQSQRQQPRQHSVRHSPNFWSSNTCGQCVLKWKHEIRDK